MYIKEAVYRTVPITNLTFPVSEGTILTINGTFYVNVYLLDWPAGINPFQG